MWEDLPDESLMLRCARGDTRAFDRLFQRHRRAVFSFLLRMVGDGPVAEDLTQECFLRVWRARERYLPTAAFRTWLFTIARRLALDERKRWQTQPVVSAWKTVDEEDSPVPGGSLAGADGTNPQEVVMARELSRVLDRALRDLPEELREVAILRDMEGMRYAEMASVLDCPLGTVKSRLNAARKRLQAVALEWMGVKKT